MFKVIKYNPKYLISNEGDVFSLHRNKYLKKQIHNGKQPYYTIKILNKKTGRYEHFFIHRLVAEHFIPNPFNLTQVNHIDCNPQNNKVENLEWVNNRYNTIHAYDNGLNRDTYFTKVYKNDNLICNYRSLRQACLKLGLPYKTVYYHTHKGYKFDFNGYTFSIMKRGDIPCQK